MAKSPEIPDRHKNVPGVFAHTLNSRLMWFKPVGAGQLMLMQRYRAQLINLRKQGDDDAYMRLAFDSSVKTLNVIDSLFLDAEDREWCEEQVLAGVLTVQDLMTVITGKTQDVPDDDAEVEVAPKTVAKKAAGVKKTANVRRTKL